MADCDKCWQKHAEFIALSNSALMSKHDFKLRLCGCDCHG